MSSILYYLFENIFLYWLLSSMFFNNDDKINRKHVALILFNQTIITFPLVYLYYYNLPSTESSILECLFKVFCCYCFQSVYFYFVHRAFHSVDFLYSRFHYVHHIYVKSSPFVAFFAHPVEHLVVNLASVFLGPIVTNMSFQLLRLWLLFSTTNAVLAHKDDTLHVLHHRYRMCNFGTRVTLDKMFGTYRIN